jgi:N-acetylglucosaminyl-diphospho-decaprenol L-rhamnosyltransferase
MDSSFSIVVVTRDRRVELVRCIERLRAVTDAPVIVVDNHSSDGTADAARRLGGLHVIEAGSNLGAAGRNLGAVAAGTPFVAFCDDDAAWGPGALDTAAAALATRPDIALLAPAIYVGGTRLDPVSEAMGRSPLGRYPGTNWPLVLGFLACATLVRRSAFLAVGGFAPWLHIGGEEALLAIDMAAAGWRLVYVPELSARHDPSPIRDSAAREQLAARNALWVAWTRRRRAGIFRSTCRICAAAVRSRASRAGMLQAVAELPTVTTHRRPVDRVLEARLALLDRTHHV